MYLLLFPDILWVNEKNSKHITVEFDVQTSGVLSNIKIVKATGSINEKEALRVMASSPKWIPAIVNGKAVPCHVIRGLYNPYANDSDDGMGALTIEGGDSPVPQEENQDENTIYNSAGIEVKPDFPGGMQKFYTFFNTNFKFPKDEDEDIKGKVFVTFIVEKDGSLSDLKVLRDFGYGAGKEVIRVLKISPKWNPGMQNGKKVRVLVTMPFSIDNSKKTVPVNNNKIEPIKDKN